MRTQYAAIVDAESAAGSGSNVGLSEAELVASYLRAVQVGTAVRVIGTPIPGKGTTGFDLRLNKDGSAVSVLAPLGIDFTIRAVAGSLYLRFPDSLPDAAVAAMIGRRRIPSQSRGKWLSATGRAGKAMARKFDRYISYDRFLRDLAEDQSGGPLTAAGAELLDGEQAARYVTANGEVHFFAATGPAYFLKGVPDPAAGKATVTLTWNQPVTVTAPPASQVFHL